MISDAHQQEMSLSRPAIHPLDVEAEPPPLTAAAADAHPPRVRMEDVQGTAGTTGGLTLRLSQFVLAAAAFSVMLSANDFASVASFRYLVAAAILQSLWSLSLAVVDIYALLVKRCLRNPRVLCLFTVGDWITSTLTFAASSTSAGITVLIRNDMDACARNHCTKFETATAMAFFSSFAVFPSFVLHFWILGSR